MLSAGNLSGDRERARWNPQDFTLLMLQGCLMTGTAPRVDWNVEMTPVDFVSSLVVKLTQQMTLGLGKIFHVINTQPIKSQYVRTKPKVLLPPVSYLSFMY